MAALQFVHLIPGYAALLLRKTYPDLMKPDGLIPRSFSWIGATDAVWKQQNHTWHFPATQSTLSFGYLDVEQDKYQYQGAAYQFIGFDELTQFQESAYRYLFSRLRKPSLMDIPLRMRAGSNPGGMGHEWVKRRFIREGRSTGRVFMPARISENPYLDREQYVESLMELDPVTRAQLLNGDWTVRSGGSIFHREWFKYSPKFETHRRVRFWDLAATEQKEGEDPDWTAGALVSELAGLYCIEHIVRRKATPKDIEDLIRTTARADGIETMQRMEQEPGASGKSLVDHYARNVLNGYNFAGIAKRKDKLVKAGPWSSAAERGHIKVCEGEWNTDFFDECEAFPTGEHDDMVDAVSGAYEALRGGALPAVVINKENDRISASRSFRERGVLI